MTVIGDSVTLAAAPALLHRYPRAYVHADVGFQAFHAPKLVAKLLSKHQVGNVLVFALGTNGNVRARDLQAIYKMIGPDRKLVLVTNHGNLPWVKKNNNVLEKFAATHQNVRVANWNGVAHRVHDFAPDGIHPGPAGGKVWVSALNAALRG